MSVDEHLGAHRTVNGVRDEKSREEEHLGEQEQPDTELSGFELLEGRVEVVREVGIRGVHRVVRVVPVAVSVAMLVAVRCRRGRVRRSFCRSGRSRDW